MMTTDPTKLRTSADIPLNLITPNEIDTRIGKLTYVDGAPSNDTIQKIQDNLDFVRALSVYMDAHQGNTVQVQPGKPAPITPVNFIEGSRLAFNTIPPSDHTYFDLINELVQEEAKRVYDSEMSSIC